MDREIAPFFAQKFPNHKKVAYRTGDRCREPAPYLAEDRGKQDDQEASLFLFLGFPLFLLPFLLLASRFWGGITETIGQHVSLLRD